MFIQKAEKEELTCSYTHQHTAEYQKQMAEGYIIGSHSFTVQKTESALLTLGTLCTKYQLQCSDSEGNLMRAVAVKCLTFYLVIYFVFETELLCVAVCPGTHHRMLGLKMFASTSLDYSKFLNCCSVLRPIISSANLLIPCPSSGP